MRNYQIYLLEEEFASHYFGRESILYHLFLDHELSNHQDKKQILKKQIDFVTRPIPNLKINQLIESSLKKFKSYTQTADGHSLQFQLPESDARMTISDRHITLVSNGNIEAETIFFELLRKYNPCFLAMDFEQNRYGWLNPIKERKFV
ncbi:sporulation inhibitor of replication protein SirA [Bacillus sp. PS06]|uniref:sporulation inhibitor of replication protein SirA n=1 Tax=Bacillus sp. PS06 TaxID=2764176 RepID=UPI0017850EB7|nr:sporulation inhibitor of replication protein SirA [Bacillus sp. PS06]MBD8068205.1 sporulation inhibitor of replication protein SirA [Bacillus sp. PS06]